jgi:hypothetical protein
MNLSTLRLLLLLLLEFALQESPPLAKEHLPFDTEPTDNIDDLELGQDFLEALP